MSTLIVIKIDFVYTKSNSVKIIHTLWLVSWSLNFCNDKIHFCRQKSIFVSQNFCDPKFYFVRQIPFCETKVDFVSQKSILCHKSLFCVTKSWQNSIFEYKTTRVPFVAPYHRGNDIEVIIGFNKSLTIERMRNK